MRTSKIKNRARRAVKKKFSYNYFHIDIFRMKTTITYNTRTHARTHTHIHTYTHKQGRQPRLVDARGHEWSG